MYDYNAGWVYWLHSSIHRVVSVGSEAFIRGSGTGLEIMDCHVDSWCVMPTLPPVSLSVFCVSSARFLSRYPSLSNNPSLSRFCKHSALTFVVRWMERFGGEPYPANKSNWSHYGPDFNKFGSAIGVSGQVQLHDCTFTNPRCNASMHEHAYKYAQCCGFSADPGEQSMWPIIASNNTIDPGFNVTDCASIAISPSSILLKCSLKAYWTFFPPLFFPTLSLNQAWAWLCVFSLGRFFCVCRRRGDALARPGQQL